MATIGVKGLIPKGIRTVSWCWNDDEKQLHTNKLNCVPYFPCSPVNILSATSLDESIKDDEGTWVQKRKYSIFTWDFGKSKNTISHSGNFLAELDIWDGFVKLVRL